MEIQLSKQPSQFEKAVVTAIETIRSCQTGLSFLAHFIGLIDALRNHPITENWVKVLEEENQKRKEAFDIDAIEGLEAEWLFLWKEYPKMESRKSLMHIKHFFTKSKEQSFQMPLNYICFSFLEFKIRYSCNECSEKFDGFIKQYPHLHMARDPKIYAEYIQTSVELDRVYLWDRLCLLEKVFQFSANAPL